MAKEMDDSQAFLFYAEKFYSGTADMLPETVGIYIRLLAKLWNMPEGLPNDLKKLARISLVSERKFNQCWNADMLSEKFYKNVNGTLQNERLEIVREKRLKKSITARESAEKRWTKTDANAMQTHSERNANGMHISKDKISKEKYIDDDKATAPYSPTPTNIDWLAELEKSESANESCQMKLNYLNCTKDEAIKLKSIFIAARKAEPDGNKQDAARHFNNWLGVAGKIELENIRSGRTVNTKRETAAERQIKEQQLADKYHGK